MSQEVRLQAAKIAEGDLDLAMLIEDYILYGKPQEEKPLASKTEVGNTTPKTVVDLDSPKGNKRQRSKSR